MVPRDGWEAAVAEHRSRWHSIHLKAAVRRPTMQIRRPRLAGVGNWRGTAEVPKIAGPDTHFKVESDANVETSFQRRMIPLTDPLGRDLRSRALRACQRSLP